MRIGSATARPVVCATGGPTCAPSSSGGSSRVVQRWICWRSTASLQSEVHTRSVRSSTPRSTRAPPLEHDSISSPGWRSRSRSSRSYSASVCACTAGASPTPRDARHGLEQVAVVVPLDEVDAVLLDQRTDPVQQVVDGLRTGEVEQLLVPRRPRGRPGRPGRAPSRGGPAPGRSRGSPSPARTTAPAACRGRAPARRAGADPAARRRPRRPSRPGPGCRRAGRRTSRRPARSARPRSRPRRRRAAARGRCRC